MKLGTSHMHSKGHEKGDKLLLRETIEQAIKKKLLFVGITDHYPLPSDIIALNPNLGKTELFNEDYLKEFEKVKKEFQDKIEILFGAEMGWSEQTKGWFVQEVKKYDFDYLIGSVHGLADKEGLYWSIDRSEEDYKKGVEKFGGIINFVKEYFNQIRNMINSGLFNVVGHLDLIKVQNKNIPLFSEKEMWYKKEVLKTLDLIKNKKTCMEINCSGWDKRCKEQYPSFWIIKEARKRGVLITLGSDGHYPEKVNRNLDRARELAIKAGYKSVVRFKNRKMIEVEI